MMSTNRVKLSATLGSAIGERYRRGRVVSTRASQFLRVKGVQSSLLPMVRVEVYSTTMCPFCVRAKRLLEARGIAYRDIDVGADDALRASVMQRSGRRTVPQIFIDGESIGGYEELAALDASGQLEDLSSEGGRVG